MSSLVESHYSESLNLRVFVPDKPTVYTETEIASSVINDVTLAFVGTFILQKPGDFCISRTLSGRQFVSVLAEPTNQGSNVVHLLLKQNEQNIGVHGMLFASGKTLGELVRSLVACHEILSGVLEKKLSFIRLVNLSAAESHNVHFSKKLVRSKIIAEDYHTAKFIGEVQLANEATQEVLFEEIKHADAYEMEKFLDQLVVAASLSSKTLPIRMPVAAFVHPPTVGYELNKEDIGNSLDFILSKQDHLLDLTQRIKLCSSAVRVMSELHHSDVFHGAVHADNFYANFKGEKKNIKEYELVFNGPRGLLISGKSNCSVDLIDYDMNAPELSFTRKLSKESGVFNIGRLFEQILKTDILKSYEKPEDECQPLREMRQLIARATRANPNHRPTMAGIVIIIREVLKMLPPSSASLNFVHYDQFVD